MSEHLQKSIALASRISGKAEDALSRLDAEMNMMKWPAELRAIMWDAVADLATIRAKEAKR